MAVLHITNGDEAVKTLQGATIEGTFLPWRDVLHEGPVPAGLALEAISRVRATFIAEQGWGVFSEVLAQFRERDTTLAGWRRFSDITLWFEYDLYDQLQFIQILAWFAEQHQTTLPVFLVQTNECITRYTTDQLQELFALRQEIQPGHLSIALEAWQAFRNATPTVLEDYLNRKQYEIDTFFPHLRKSLQRHLEQFPSVQNGLARSEHRILACIADGIHSVQEILRQINNETTDVLMLTDLALNSCLKALAAGPTPAVVFDGTTVRLTVTGEALLDNTADNIAIRGIDRWLGGVHLCASMPLWRWDTQKNYLVQDPVFPQPESVG